MKERYRDRSGVGIDFRLRGVPTSVLARAEIIGLADGCMCQRADAVP